MQRNSVVSLRPPSADVQATYGCVDWYLYQNSPLPPAQSDMLTDPAIVAPCSSIIERAAAAAGTAVTVASHVVSPAEAGVW